MIHNQNQNQAQAQAQAKRNMKDGVDNKLILKIHVFQLYLRLQEPFNDEFEWMR